MISTVANYQILSTYTCLYIALSLYIICTCHNGIGTFINSYYRGCLIFWSFSLRMVLLLMFLFHSYLGLGIFFLLAMSMSVINIH